VGVVAPALEYEILGPLRVRSEEGEVPVPGARRRALLLRLLMDANRPVTSDRLIEDLWEGDPPAGASSTLQSHLSYLRKTLGSESLERRGNAYLIRAGDDTLDAGQFEQESNEGRDAFAHKDLDRADTLLAAALGRWRGEPLADAKQAAWALPEAGRLSEVRLATAETWHEILMVQGRHPEIIASTESILLDHPWQERLWGQLMVALYQSGRQAEALRAYQRIRTRLNEELGIDPSPELAALDGAILDQRPDLSWTPSPSATGGLSPGANAARGPEVTIETSEGVQELSAVPTRLEIESGAPFVGRRRELDRLADAWARAQRGSRRAVLLGGEPGMGKTSLARAFAHSVSDQQAVVLYGRCDEDLGIPYQPWIEALTHVSRHGPDVLFDGHPPSRMAQLARLVPELTARTGVDASESVADETERHLLFSAVTDLIARCTKLAPTLLVLDDLHWADQESIRLLRHVIGADAVARLLVVANYRDTELESGHAMADALALLRREPGVERVDLRGLDDGELLALVQTHTGHEVLEQAGSALRDDLLEDTGGNPFFVGEILRNLAESGALRPPEEGGEPVVRQGVPGLPASVREVVAHRVGRLGGPAVAWLTTASVIGREFDIDLLGAVVRADQEDLLNVMERALAAAILVEGEEPGWFGFAHALFGQSLYADLSALRRARAHQVVAEALEDRCGDDPGARVGELAIHWAQAPRPASLDKAIGYSHLAGDRALSQLAPDEAERWYTEALRMAEQRSGGDGQQRVRLLISLGEAQRQAGVPSHRETLLAAARLAHERGEASLLTRAVLANNRGQATSAMAVDKEKLACIDDALDLLAGGEAGPRARLLALKATELTYGASLEERMALGATALSLASDTGDPDTFVATADLVLWATASADTLAWRERIVERVLDEARRSTDDAVQFSAYNWRAMVALERGRRDEFEECNTTARSLAEHVPGTGYLAARFVSCWLDSDLDKAEQAMSQGLEERSAAGDPDALVMYGIQLMTLRWAHGRSEEVADAVGQAAAEYPANPGFRAVTAALLAERDDRDAAIAQLDREGAEGFETPRDQSWSTTVALWAEACVLAGAETHAPALTELLAPIADQVVYNGATVLGASAHFLGGLAALQDQRDVAEGHFEQALAVHERLGCPFFVARTLWWWGAFLVGGTPSERQRGVAQLEQAVAIAQARGFTVVEERARLLLDVSPR
jgi:DNA-binding SARP family transcriptional activator